MLPVLACLAILSSPALAAEESFVIADASAPQQRFMSLSNVRAGIRNDNGLKPTQASRSDRQAMQDGFMRLDRSTLKPQHSFRGANVTSQNGVKVVRPVADAAPQVTPGSDDDVTLDLFSDDEEPATASFKNAMRGPRVTYGAVRHSWPLPTSAPQEFTSGYGRRADPFTGKPAFHGGIDIAGATGTPVLASAEGTVTKVEQGKGLGKYVAVQHRDGTESYYGHLSAQNVRIGQHVMQGQKVGALGSTGRSTGPHLDYRIKKDGENINPMTVLRMPSSVDRKVAMR